MTKLESYVGKRYSHPQYGEVKVIGVSSAGSDYSRVIYDRLRIHGTVPPFTERWVGLNTFLKKTTVLEKQDLRKNNGGKREGAGPKRKYTEDQPRINRGCQLTDAEYRYLVFRYGGFTAAVRSLLTPGWESEE